MFDKIQMIQMMKTSISNNRISQMKKLVRKQQPINQKPFNKSAMKKHSFKELTFQGMN